MKGFAEARSIQEQCIVYLVDDDADVREGVKALLQSVSLRCETFASTTEFLQHDRGDVVCCLVASDRKLGLKKLAAAAGAKDAGMLAPPAAERATGYHVGGISPFGQKKRVRVFVDRVALAADTIIVNGGRRGLQIELAPADLVRLLAATAADLS